MKYFQGLRKYFRKYNITNFKSQGQEVGSGLVNWTRASENKILRNNWSFDLKLRTWPRIKLLLEIIIF